MPTTDLPNADLPEADAESQSENLLVLPLPDGVIFPDMVVTVTMQSAEARQILASAGDDRLLLVPRIDGVFAQVGVIATIADRGSLPDGSPTVTLRAHGRARVGTGVAGPTDGLWVAAEPVFDPVPGREITDLAIEYRAAATNLLDRVGGRRMVGALPAVEQPGPLADSIAYWPDLSIERRVELLETIDLEDRLTLATEWVKEALTEFEIREKINSDVAEDLESTQREAILRRQMAAIRSELGDSDSDGDAVAEYRSRLDELVVDGALTEAAVEAVGKEIDRLERTGNESMEANWIRTWLDTVFDLPWTKRSEERLDLTQARAILDADHTGLTEVKDRLIEHLAVRKLRAERGVSDHGETSNSRRSGGAILALVGPPGVGKTSLGESIARSLGRKFVRLALGGVRDEAEIRGHRRTYVGSRPGRLVAALREADSMNPVILLDEVDKLSAGWAGDPSAALLEVLDPAQNHSFRDHYLEFELDLSDVVFIATANVLDTIPGPLLDRMELITLDGYTEIEKTSIARDHLLPRLIERNGLRPAEVEITDEALEHIAARYTREAGVRRLERQLDKVLRKTATRIASDALVENLERSGSTDEAADGTDEAEKTDEETNGTDEAEKTDEETNGTDEAEKTDEETGPITVETAESAETAVVTIDDLDGLLGKPIPDEEVEDRIDRPGIATGLAVTGAGGGVLFVESALVGGSSESGGGEPILTGQLGDVMKESATIVRSIVSAQAEARGFEMPTDKRIHIHFPAGAVPKDGPSAGVTMTTALVSLLTGRKVRSDVAMTGEVTLQGRVLPIGGVKQKVMAAHRAGLTTVLLPKGNARDLEDIPSEIRDAMTIELVSEVDQLLDLALV